MNTVRQRGFTLIELVVVIVILGILSAFAVPRFIGLEVQARTASVNALTGSLRSSSSLAHSLTIAQGLPANGAVSMEGTPVAMAFWYPTQASIQNTLQDTSGFNLVNVGATRQFQRVGATTPATCSVTYTPPTVAGNAPVITPAVAGC